MSINDMVQHMGSVTAAENRRLAKQARLDALIAEAVAGGARSVREVCALVRERSYHEGYAVGMRARLDQVRP